MQYAVKRVCRSCAHFRPGQRNECVRLHFTVAEPDHTSCSEWEAAK